MQKIKNRNLFLYTFLPVAIFSMFFLSNLNKVYAQTSGGTVLCTNSSTNQYLIVSSQYSCPIGFNISPSYFDLSDYNPVTDYNQYLNLSGANTQSNNQSNNKTNISTTSQSNLQNNTQPVIQDRNVIIEPDPTLASGPFLNLDPLDYPYCVSLSHDLSYGSRDNSTKGDVSALQSYLTDRGFLETGATGFYGRSTEIGVKRFEYRNQIEVNGMVRQDFRDIVKELTCQKYQKISYVDKPLSPSKNFANANTTKITTTATSKSTSTIIPTTKIATTQPVTKATSKTIIPSTNANVTKAPTGVVSITPAPTNPNPISGPILDNTKLSSPYGVLSLSNRNNLYFTFNTTSPSPTICININGTDCSLTTNNIAIKEGVNGNLYEAVNLSGKWSITIYSNSVWGGVGARAAIYLKDNANSNTLSIYTVSVSN